MDCAIPETQRLRNLADRQPGFPASAGSGPILDTFVRICCGIRGIIQLET